jgi:Dihaem cytochrome c
MGWALAQWTGAMIVPGNVSAAEPSAIVETRVLLGAAPQPVTGEVDPVPPKLKLGQEIYLENCATCHVGIPPAVFPTETWRRVIQDPQHYGVQIQPLRDPFRRLMWNYLQTGSRTHLPSEAIPYRVVQSRFFKALHPKVKFSSPAKINGCVTCHPGASTYDFRSLTAEWQNAP